MQVYIVSTVSLSAFMKRLKCGFDYVRQPNESWTISQSFGSEFRKKTDPDPTLEKRDST